MSPLVTAVWRLAVMGRKTASSWSVVSTVEYRASRAVLSLVFDSARTLVLNWANDMDSMLITAGASDSPLHHKWVMSHSLEVGSYGGPQVCEMERSHEW